MRISDWRSDVCSSDLKHDHVIFSVQHMSAQLGDAQLVELRPILDRFFAAGQRLGDGFKGHALFCQRVQLLKLFAGPRLPVRSEEHTSELQSLMRISYAVFCLKKKKMKTITKVCK